MLIVSNIAFGFRFTFRLHIENPTIQGRNENRICLFSMGNTFAAGGRFVHNAKNLLVQVYQVVCPVFPLQFSTDSWFRKSPAGLFYPRGMQGFHTLSFQAPFDYNCSVISCKTSALVCIVHHMKFYWS